MLLGAVSTGSLSRGGWSTDVQRQDGFFNRPAMVAAFSEVGIALGALSTGPSRRKFSVVFRPWKPSFGIAVPNDMRPGTERDFSIPDAILQEGGYPRARGEFEAPPKGTWAA
mmetsp:Transcript_14221/g.39172  ORF Transcript_14221/g.39172 Transcript_14221/m.39172 type:complete len:112 (-) Transcript_14221:2-337(-)